MRAFQITETASETMYQDSRMVALYAEPYEDRDNEYLDLVDQYYQDAVTRQWGYFGLAHPGYHWASCSYPVDASPAVRELQRDPWAV